MENRSSSEVKKENKYKSDRSSSLRWVFSHVSNHKFIFFSSLFLTIISSVFLAFVPYYIGEIFNLQLNNELTYSKLLKYIIIIFLLGLGGGLFSLLQNYGTQIVGQRIERDSRDELFSSLLSKSLTFHDSQNKGEIMSRVTWDVKYLYYMMNPGFNLVFTSTIRLIIPLVFISIINPQLLIVPLIYSIIFIIVLRMYNKKLTPWSYKARSSFAQINSKLNDIISGINTVKSSGTSQEEIQGFNDALLENKKSNVKIGQIQARYWPLLLLGISISIGIYHSYILVSNNIISIGEMISFILLFQMLRYPTFINYVAVTIMTLGLASATRVLDMINNQTQIDDNLTGYSQEISGPIEFRNIYFGYNQDEMILKNISFKINPKEKVSLVGLTGSGKSTLTKLISRLYDPQSGEILIDGVNVKEWSLDSLRGQIAIVEQDIFLFSASIKDNIAFGKIDASMDEIIECAKIANAHEFIVRLTGGYETEVGERGIKLSGGQRQRISIARAILSNPKILILDDASSAIDSQTEEEINMALQTAMENRISIIITNRLHQIKKADKIIVIEDGIIIDQGEHRHLIENCLMYQQLFSPTSRIRDETEMSFGGP